MNKRNSTGDTQLKLDIASDLVIEKLFSQVKCIKSIVSEEQDEINHLHEDGEYLIAYDPLDGSSLVDVNLSVGFYLWNLQRTLLWKTYHSNGLCCFWTKS